MDHAIPSKAWPFVEQLVPIGLWLVELLDDIPDRDPHELALDLDPGLAPYAWSNPAEWSRRRPPLGR